MFDVEKRNMKPSDIPQALLNKSTWDMPSQMLLLFSDKASTTYR